ncbi:MAG: hypothetical protein RL483_785 [Pseudomonadota bacterium]
MQAGLSLRLFMGFLLASLLGLVVGCSPTYDWRTLSDEAQDWQATFPGKPAKVERTIQMSLPGGPAAVVLSLRAVRIGEQTFSVGVGRLDQTAKGPQLMQLLEALQASRVQNLQGRITQTSPLPNGRSLAATGQMTLKPDAAPVAARLQMVSFVHQNQVIEVISAGPVADFNEEAAAQFLESLKLGL